MKGDGGDVGAPLLAMRAFGVDGRMDVEGVAREIAGTEARASCCSESGKTVIGGLKLTCTYKTRRNDAKMS